MLDFSMYNKNTSVYCKRVLRIKFVLPKDKRREVNLNVVRFPFAPLAMLYSKMMKYLPTFFFLSLSFFFFLFRYSWADLIPFLFFSRRTPWRRRVHNTRFGLIASISPAHRELFTKFHVLRKTARIQKKKPTLNSSIVLRNDLDDWSTRPCDVCICTQRGFINVNKLRPSLPPPPKRIMFFFSTADIYFSSVKYFTRNPIYFIHFGYK